MMLYFQVNGLRIPNESVIVRYAMQSMQILPHMRGLRRHLLSHAEHSNIRRHARELHVARVVRRPHTQ